MTIGGVYRQISNLLTKYLHKLLSWMKFGLWGPFYISPKAVLVGPQHIKIASGAIIFTGSELNTSGAPYSFPFRTKVASGFITIGFNSKIKNHALLFTYQGSISIGNNCTVNPYSIIYGEGGVKIGNDVMIAAHCIIVSSSHLHKELHTPMNTQGISSRGIVIHDNVWIGAGVKILDGVTIGAGAIIAAGAVVTRSIPDFAIAGGVPANIIRMRDGR